MLSRDAGSSTGPLCAERGSTRREDRDSNPGASCPANGFQDRRLRPLGHPPARRVPPHLSYLPVRPRVAAPRGSDATTGGNDMKDQEHAPITEHETKQVDRANTAGSTPVVFVHGLWLLPTSWDRWAELFEKNGYTALTPGWPDDPDTVAQAKAHPEVFANKSVGDVADHFEDVIRGLRKKPAIIGHSFGGLLAQILAGRGLAKVSVAIDPAPFRGVLPLPISSLRSASPVLKNPANYHRAVPLTYEQFQYAFANAVDENEAKELYETYAVPGPGTPIFQEPARTSIRGPK